MNTMVVLHFKMTIWVIFVSMANLIKSGRTDLINKIGCYYISM
jgi:hypothetical protein